MVCVESQVPFIFFLIVSAPFKIHSLCVLYVFAEHFFIFSFSELLFLGLFEVIVVGPEIKIVLELFNFGCVVNIFLAFGRHIRSYHLYLYPFKIFEIKVSLLLVIVRIEDLML
jgi:hypothetical protein